MSKFKRSYLVTIEAEAKGMVLGWGDASHERAHLEAHAGELADAVERYFQTTLTDRKVTVEAVQFPPLPKATTEGVVYDGSIGGLVKEL